MDDLFVLKFFSLSTFPLHKVSDRYLKAHWSVHEIEALEIENQYPSMYRNTEGKAAAIFADFQS